MITDFERQANWKSADELATAMYPGLTFDTALPQGWVNQMMTEFDPRQRFVWAYPEGYGFLGIPLPVTLTAYTDFTGNVVAPATKEEMYAVIWDACCQ